MALRAGPTAAMRPLPTQRQPYPLIEPCSPRGGKRFRREFALREIVISCTRRAR